MIPRATPRLRRAFTLIELLVTISIIAILASMTMGSISIVRDQAKKAQCRNNLRSLALAAIGYTNDNEGLFSLAANHSWGDSQWPAGLATSGSPSSAFPSACVNSYYSGAVQPYLYATLIDYDVIPVSPGGATPNSLRCPLRQSKVASNSRPYMQAANNNWGTSYWWNYPMAAGKPMAAHGASRARLIFDWFYPDWVAYDFMHRDATTNTIFADMHGECETYAANRTLNPDVTSGAKPGLLTNPWYTNGWIQ